MAVIDWLSISGIIVDIILFFIVAGNAALGYRRGLTKVIFHLFSGLVAIILVFILYKPTTNYIINNTGFSEKLENIFQEKMEYLFEKEETHETEDIEEDSSMIAMLGIFIGDEIENVISETTESIIDYVSVQISHKVISVLVFFILFAVIRLLLYIFRNYIELVANLPIIRVFDGAGGMIYGVIRGFLIIYAVFAILSLIMPIVGDTIIFSAIQDAPIGSKMFHNNIILNLIFK